MLRIARLAPLLFAGCLAFGAYQPGTPKSSKHPAPVNSTLANYHPSTQRHLPAHRAPLFPEADSAVNARVLMLNYSSYDSLYVTKVKHLISKRLPRAATTDFWDGTPQALRTALAGQHIAVVTYPAGGKMNRIAEYGKVLAEFARKGGAVVFSGTDKFGLLQTYGLIDLDFGYFCSDLSVHTAAQEHPILQNTPAEFALTNYVYPLDISDPAFVTLADVQGYPAIGYKPLGLGKVVYIGLEYYYDESVSSSILENTLRWLAPPVPVAPVVAQILNDALATAATPMAGNENWSARAPRVKRTEEVLYAGGTSRNPSIELKLFPNPYTEKASLTFDLPRLSVVSVELTDESGKLVATPLKRQILSPGPMQVEIPNVEPGIYFVNCQIDGKNDVRKIVKVAR